ncbi:glycoside hydrolase family 16 protein [Candidatus Symbiobacter mobilis]|uniref:glycoside hydrolase family 16 protein n=1 Tax=Candidatus Symbiobacter mobilis TaxID=1436290 RepID=UPI001650DFE2|nr:glycoside hydrolase family 16 protein [Candidatus Symbiobacter mobilis]
MVPVSAGEVMASDNPPDAVAGFVSGRQEWALVWSDEFDREGLPDPTKWTYDVDRNAAGWYNQELQYYAHERKENAHVANGVLSITARREQLRSMPDYGGQDYTSARLMTRNLPGGEWTYGFFEVRAKLPCSRGLWPAIWLLGVGGVWPDDGEIDIMEQKGLTDADKLSVQAALHTKAYNHAGGSMGKSREETHSVPTACTAFHNYQLRWTDQDIVIGVDDVPYFHFQKPHHARRSVWPFDRPHYLLLNVAVGGVLGGKVPQEFEHDAMLVDYVRIYSLSVVEKKPDGATPASVPASGAQGADTPAISH